MVMSYDYVRSVYGSDEWLTLMTSAPMVDSMRVRARARE